MIRALVVLFILGAAGSIGYAAYKTYNDMKQTIATQQSEITALQSAKQTQDQTIAKQAEDLERNASEMRRLSVALNAANSDLDDLRRLLIRHDLTKLALEKPGLIEKRINDATQDVFDQLERDTRPDSVR